LHHLRNSLDRNSASVPKMGIPQYRHWQCRSLCLRFLCK
jgi:hypothetical protein